LTKVNNVTAVTDFLALWQELNDDFWREEFSKKSEVFFLTEEPLKK